MNSNNRIAATLFPRDIVCLRNISINTPHKGIIIIIITIICCNWVVTRWQWLSTLKIKQYVLPKRPRLPTRLHGVTPNLIAPNKYLMNSIILDIPASTLVHFSSEKLRK